MEGRAMHLPRSYLRGLVLVSLILSLHIHILDHVTSLLALVWDEGQIYAFTEGDVAMLSPDMSGSSSIFITPRPACTLSLLSMVLWGFPALQRRRGPAAPPPAWHMERKGIYLL